MLYCFVLVGWFLAAEDMCNLPIFNEANIFILNNEDWWQGGNLAV
ncbi:Hypothetical protein CulFRC11_0338 [Corynebacterium ramonii]|uniref:Uncharacterized protein n=1 Tax=Corynebacterium ramonii TaxID=3026968 RepID=A0ABM5RQ62_9CORY|nr:Hypothetical protein CulFRC11_0338 [Corynebacterium ramonii FRC0011]ESU59041.1 hypothetical protein D881_02410 [Corynebacterium ulcerans NCTC 12077]